MKIVLNDVTEGVVDRLEDALSDLVNAHTYIWEGTANDVYKYEIDITEEPDTEEDYDLENVAIIYKNGYYMFEIVNANQYSTVDIKNNEVGSVVIV